MVKCTVCNKVISIYDKKPYNNFHNIYCEECANNIPDIHNRFIGANLRDDNIGSFAAFFSTVDNMVLICGWGKDDKFYWDYITLKEYEETYQRRENNE